MIEREAVVSEKTEAAEITVRFAPDGTTVVCSTIAGLTGVRIDPDRMRKLAEQLYKITQEILGG